MHYRNGREAKNGDPVIQLGMSGPDAGKIKAAGVLYGATPGNDFCNGNIAPTQNVVTGACMCDCMHVEDVEEMIARADLDRRPDVDPRQGLLIYEVRDGVGRRTVSAVGDPRASRDFAVRWENDAGTHGFNLGFFRFQEGPIKEAGINGVHNEDLLAIVRARLQVFQASPYACDENARALAGIEAAMVALDERTARRIREGTEGTSSGI